MQKPRPTAHQLSRLFWTLAFLLAFVIAGGFPTRGQVVINEFAAAPSDRLLRWVPAAFPPEPETAWFSPLFDDSSWTSAPGGFGYGDEDRYDYTVVNLQGVAVSLYLRRNFSVPAQDAARSDALTFTVDYDDGYVAYLNGVEISRRNLGRPGEPIPFSRVADAQHEAGIPETILLQSASALLVPGTNVLAIQVHNASLQSSDLALIADLAISGTPALELVRHEDIWKYFIGTSQPPGLYAHLDFSSVARLGTGLSWYDPCFDDSSWNEGPGKIGFGHPGINTYVNVRTLAASLYFRRTFIATSEQAARQEPLELAIDYDDGFIAYLNGVEVARRNLGGYGGFVYHDQPAYHIRQATGPETFTLRVAAADLLAPGTNVLAIQVHNVSLEDYDLALAADLRIPGSPAVELVRYDDLWKYTIGTHEPSGGLPDEDGEFSDWIELYNTGTVPVSLNGWALTDDPARPAKWILPDISLPGGGYLIVFASGKDRRVPGSTPLHTNFSLDADGEYLALYNAAAPRQLASEFAPVFPPQSAFHSYGRSGSEGEYRYFDTLTPGEANASGASFEGMVAEPVFSVHSGFYDTSFTLFLSCPTPGAVIRYATDGGEPDPAMSPAYTGPIQIDRSVVIRAKAFKEGWVPSPIVTRTYLLHQPEPVKSLPALSLVGHPQRNLFEPHGVLAIMGGVYGDIETWCVNCWMPEDLDDYHNPLQHGRPFERPVAVALLDPAGEAGFDVDCGLRISGGSWIRYHLLRREDWTLANAKSSFRFYFRGSYGPSQLNFPLFPGSRVEQFDVLTLRAGLNDSRNPFLRDELVRRLHIGMGHVGSHGIFVNLFVNGELKNYYNLVERLDEDFYQSWYISDADWDVLRGQHNLLEPEIGEGDTEKWDELFAFVTANDLSQPGNFEIAAALLDLENFVDYLLVNLYGATADWPEANWTAARERSAGGIFRFYVWDAEGAFGAPGADHKPVDYNSVAGDLEQTHAPITILYQQLVKNADFRLLFADRIQKHFFGQGALTDENISARYLELQETLQDIIEWVYPEDFDTSIRDVWIPQRRSILLGHLAAAGLWPALAAPAFDPPGGVVTRGTMLEIANPNPSGTVYFTTDGTDPRLRGTGEVAATAQEYTTPIALQSPLPFTARVRDGTEWSALAEATFELRAASPGDIIISEFFADASGDDTNKEWFELFNTTDTDIDITGWSIADNDADLHIITGLNPIIVPAKGYLVLGETENTSLNGGVPVDYAYGEAITLGNEGDELVLLQSGAVIHSIGYGAFKTAPFPILTPVYTPLVKGAALGMGDDYCEAAVSFWQVQGSLYGLDGRGTPGADNDGVTVCAEDQTPPTLLGAKFARRDLLLLQFNESLDPASADDVTRYSVGGGIGQPATVRMALDHQVLLGFASPLSPEVSHTVTVVGVSDSWGNVISVPQQASTRFSIPRISISEVMYNNRGTDIEWIELFNPGAQPVDLSGWYLTDDDEYPAQGEGAVILPPGTVIQPEERLVVNLWNDANFSLWQMPESIRVIHPVVVLQGALSNTGDNIALFDSAFGGNLVDGSLSVAFPDLSVDGESIEKIDEWFPWGDRETIPHNFRRAEAPLGFETGLNENLEPLSDRATPGRPNGLWPATPSTFWQLY